MILDNVTFTGPPIACTDSIRLLTPCLRSLLKQINGFVQFGGGFHVRGICHTPPWHSLQKAWHGDEAFHCFYSTVSEQDIPFAEDCMGDQFLLRNDLVIKLLAETGELEELGMTFIEFLEEVQADPVQALGLDALLQFQEKGGTLESGELLNVYPPFCVKESSEGDSLRAVPAHERHRFLADLANRLRDVSDGQRIEIIV